MAKDLNMSHATFRKIRIIEEKFGKDWQTDYPDKSVDAMYNLIIGDKRKNLFCKVNPETKDKLDQMVDYHGIMMSELVEKLVKEEYDRFVVVLNTKVSEMASQFARSEDV